MAQLIPMISQKEIQKSVQKMGGDISQAYANKDLVLVGILKGSFIFLSDLSRAISIDHEIDFVGTSSYTGTEASGIIEFTKKPDLDLEGKDLLLVEDIVDTGRTLMALMDFFSSFNPASIKLCTLINKEERRALAVEVNYACFTIEKGFIVGYGLDYNEKYRNLPAIYDLKL